MTGWLHGGLFVTAYGGPPWQMLSALTAMSGAVVGVLAGGSYGFFRADKLKLAHTVVQLGTLGTLVGYGAGTLSNVPPLNGLNMASWGLAGTAVGVLTGVALNETRPPTAGALMLGATVGYGTAVALGGLALTSRYSFEGSFGLAMLGGGAAGLMTTMVAAPAEIGVIPCAAATVGGTVVATMLGLGVATVETIQLGADATAPFTEGSGWAIVAGYATGAVVAGGLATLLPAEWDPLLTEAVAIVPPTVSVLPSVEDPRVAVPIAALGGTF
jgi:hypothetical protein